MAQNVSHRDIFSLKLEDITSFEQGKKHAQDIVFYLLESQTIPGMAVTITRKGSIVWEQGYGWANVKQQIPVSPTQTLFRIASVSKPISAMGLAKMYEQNLMDWNCSLYDYLPEFPKKAFDFTIKQIGGHLAGIRGYKTREIFSNKPLTISQGIEMFADDPLLFAPGTQYSYNSFGWNLISLVMQEVAQMPFELYMKEHVFIPLEMHNTLPDMGGLLQHQAVPYSKGKKGFYPSVSVNNFYKLAGGGFLSTSHDVAKLGNALLESKFLPNDIQQEMLQTQCVDNQQETGYGIGWQSTFDWNNRLYYGHVGNGIGGYAWFYVYPQEQVVVSMCMNITNPSINTYLQRIIDCILEGVKHIEE